MFSDSNIPISGEGNGLPLIRNGQSTLGSLGPWQFMPRAQAHAFQINEIFQKLRNSDAPQPGSSSDRFHPPRLPALPHGSLPLQPARQQPMLPRALLAAPQPAALAAPEPIQTPFTAEELNDLRNMNEGRRENLPDVQDPTHLLSEFKKIEGGSVYENPGFENNCAFYAAITAWIKAEYPHCDLEHPYVKALIYNAAAREREASSQWLMSHQQDPETWKALLITIREEPFFRSLPPTTQETIEKNIEGREPMTEAERKLLSPVIENYLAEITVPGSMCGHATHHALSRRWGYKIKVFHGNDRKLSFHDPKNGMQKETLLIRRDGNHFVTLLCSEEEVNRRGVEKDELLRAERVAVGFRRGEMISPMYQHITLSHGLLYLDKKALPPLDSRNFQDFVSDFFPIDHYDENFPKAPILDGPARKQIQKARVLLVWIFTLKFLGLKLSEEGVVPIDPQRANGALPYWIEQIKNHPVKMTRILKSLKFLGLEPQARALLRRLETMPAAFKKEDKENQEWIEKSLVIWKAACGASANPPNLAAPRAAASAAQAGAPRAAASAAAAAQAGAPLVQSAVMTPSAQSAAAFQPDQLSPPDFSPKVILGMLWLELRPNERPLIQIRVDKTFAEWVEHFKSYSSIAIGLKRLIATREAPLARSVLQFLETLPAIMEKESRENLPWIEKSLMIWRDIVEQADEFDPQVIAEDGNDLFYAVVAAKKKKENKNLEDPAVRKEIHEEGLKLKTESLALIRSWLKLKCPERERVLCEARQFLLSNIEQTLKQPNLPKEEREKALTLQKKLASLSFDNNELFACGICGVYLARISEGRAVIRDGIFFSALSELTGCMLTFYENRQHCRITYLPPGLKYLSQLAVIRRGKRYCAIL